MGSKYYVNPDTGQRVYIKDKIPSLSQYRKSSAQDAIDSTKVDKVDGKGLSTNDYTNAAKAKVDAIPSNPKYTDTVYDDTDIKEELEYVIHYEDSSIDPASVSYVLSSEYEEKIEEIEDKLDDFPVANTIAVRQDLVNYQTVLTDAQKLAISKKWFENTLTAEEQEMARTAIGAVKKSGYTELLNTATTEEKQFVYNFGTTWYSSIRVRIVFPICSTGIVYRYTKMFGSSGNSVMTYPTSGNTGSFSNHLYFENSDGFLESHYIRSVTASTETSGFYTHDDFTFNPDFGRCTKLESLVNYPVGTTIQIWAKI